MPTLNQFPLLGDSLFFCWTRIPSWSLFWFGGYWLTLTKNSHSKTVTVGWFELRKISWIYVGSRELMSLPIEISWLLNCDLWSFPFVPQKISFSRRWSALRKWHPSTLQWKSSAEHGIFLFFQGGGGAEAWGVLSAAIFPWLKSFFFFFRNVRSNWPIDLERPTNFNLSLHIFVHFFEYLEGNQVFFQTNKNSLKFCGRKTHQVSKFLFLCFCFWEPAQVDAVDDQHFPFLGAFTPWFFKIFWRRQTWESFFWLTWIWFPVWRVFFSFLIFLWTKYISKSIYIYINYICWIDVYLRASTIWETYL